MFFCVGLRCFNSMSTELSEDIAQMLYLSINPRLALCQRNSGIHDEVRDWETPQPCFTLWVHQDMSLPLKSTSCIIKSHGTLPGRTWEDYLYWRINSMCQLAPYGCLNLNLNDRVYRLMSPASCCRLHYNSQQ